MLTLPSGTDAESAREALARAGITGVEVDVRQPTLDEVFLHLTEASTDTIPTTEEVSR